MHQHFRFVAFTYYSARYFFVSPSNFKIFQRMKVYFWVNPWRKILSEIKIAKIFEQDKTDVEYNEEIEKYLNKFNNSKLPSKRASCYNREAHTNIGRQMKIYLQGRSEQTLDNVVKCRRKLKKTGEVYKNSLTKAR